MPRTSGCRLNQQIFENRNSRRVSLFHGDRGSFKATVYLEQVIEDLFGRIDMNMNGVIGYKEFKGLLECIGKNIQED